MSRQGLALLRHNVPRSHDKLPFVVSFCSSVPTNTSFPGCWLMFPVPGFRILFSGAGNAPGLPWPCL